MTVSHIVIGPGVGATLGAKHSDQRVAAVSLQPEVFTNVTSVRVLKIMIAHIEKDDPLDSKIAVQQSPLENWLFIRILHNKKALQTGTVMGPSTMVTIDNSDGDIPWTNDERYAFYNTPDRNLHHQQQTTDVYRFDYNPSFSRLSNVCACISMHVGDKYATNDSGDMMHKITFDKPMTLTTELDVDVTPLFTMRKFTDGTTSESANFEHAYKLVSCILEIEHDNGHHEQKGITIR